MSRTDRTRTVYRRYSPTHVVVTVTYRGRHAVVVLDRVPDEYAPNDLLWQRCSEYLKRVARQPPWAKSGRISGSETYLWVTGVAAAEADMVARAVYRLATDPTATPEDLQPEPLASTLADTARSRQPTL